ncbi:MAG: WD40 repeat domain-containing protein [Ignavibacteriae bacterium]|nr:WD40 repeat domain-containing protein [Ignavibacteria bacterium]MBI3365956.1 WD40 repeat domain-containing protein [Ignavibacteriota bacterium]
MRLLLILFLAALGVSQTPAQKVLELLREIPLPHVEGRIDHMDVDMAHQQLFVVALGNNSVEIVDLKQGKVVRSINALDEPQGICYIPKSDRIVVANGGDGSVRIFDGSTFAEVERVKFSDDADNVRYDALMNRIYVGFGDGALGIIDASTFKEIGRIALPGHPESFQFGRDSSRIIVNVPSAKQIVVLDARNQKRISSIALEDESANFPMALDRELHLLFIGCRKPSRLLVIDAKSQRILSKVDIDSDTDDISYDQKNRRIYISCGSGFLDVIERNDSSDYTVTSRIKTASGARTSFFALQLNQLFLAIPHRGDQGAAVWVYDVKH